MEILLFGQHFAEYILTLGSGFTGEEKVTICLYDRNFKEEIPSSNKFGLNGIQPVLLPMPGPGKPLRFLKSVLQFRKLVRKIKPDIIHFQEIPKGYTFACWLCAGNSTRVLTIHDVRSHPGGDSATTLRQEFIKKYMRKSAELLIVHGQQLFHKVEEFHPALATKTKIIPHPAFNGTKLPGANNVVEKQLLFFGRISKYKGLKYLVEACIKLQHKGYIFSLVIAGEGDDFDSNKDSLKEISQLTIINRRILPDEIEPLFVSSDIIVLPYIEASQSGVAAYALGFGKPCVASRTGSIPEMIQDHYNGLLSVPGDVDSLAQCLEELLDNKQLKQQFSTSAAQLAATVYSPEAVAKSTLRLYKEINNEVERIPGRLEQFKRFTNLDF